METTVVSQLFEEIKKDLKDHLAEVVKETVNGKIDKIQVQMNGQDAILKTIQQDISKLKIDTNPLIDDRKTVTNLGKFIIWVGGIILMVAAILKLIK